MSDFRELSVEETEELAWSIATQAHFGQMYGDNDPYINHVRRVYDRVAQVSVGREFEHIAKLVAILHDVVEDTTVTLEEIKRRFGHRVFNGVWSMTRHKGSESYFDYIKRVKENPVASLVKTCDLVENLKNCYLKQGKYLRLIYRYEKAIAMLAARDF